MKIRSGFVANSSSSSFAVGLKKEPKNVEELHSMLFNGIPEINGIDTKILADCIFNDINRKSSRNVNKKYVKRRLFESCVEQEYIKLLLENDEVLDKMENNAINEYNKKYNETNSREESSKLYNELCEKIKEFRETLWKKAEEIAQPKSDNILIRLRDIFLFTVTYSDECGSLQSTLEHGNVFRNSEFVIRENNH